MQPEEYPSRRHQSQARRLLYFAAALWLLLLPMVGSAQYTSVTNNGAITITRWTDSGGIATIPDSIYGLPVVSIGTNAFQNLTGLIGVVIPDSITNIGNFAFYRCTDLRSVTIPNSVTSMGSGAFYSCFGLTSATISSGLTSIGDFAFVGCTNLASATIPDSVTSIGEAAFENCSSLTVVTIPDSVISIGESAFYGCYGLTNATIGNGVTYLAYDAFSECSSLTSITIPGSVTNIGDSLDGDSAFYYSDGLTNITVDLLNKAYSSLGGVLFNKDRTLLIQYPAGSAQTTCTIPNGVTSIDKYAFQDCTNLIDVIFPKSVTNIDSYVFGSCDNLETLFFKGNAPSSEWNSIADNFNLTAAFYLPGTTGWNQFATNTQLLTVLWNPEAQTVDGHFGVQSNQFRFPITGTSNDMVVVEASTNLTNPVWLPLQTNTLNGNPVNFTDPQWTNFPGRFYRLRSP